MKKLVFLSLLSVALLTSCGNGAQKDALKAQNDSLMVELSNRNAELDDIMGCLLYTSGLKECISHPALLPKPFLSP